MIIPSEVIYKNLSKVNKIILKRRHLKIKVALPYIITFALLILLFLYSTNLYHNIMSQTGREKETNNNYYKPMNNNDYNNSRT